MEYTNNLPVNAPFDMRKSVSREILIKNDPMTRKPNGFDRMDKGSGTELSPNYKGSNITIDPNDPRLTVVDGRVQVLVIVPEKKKKGGEVEYDFAGCMVHCDQTEVKQRNDFNLNSIPYDSDRGCCSLGAGYGGAIPMSEAFSYSEAKNRKGVTKAMSFDGKDREVLEEQMKKCGLDVTRTFQGGKYKSQTVIVPMSGELAPNKNGTGHVLTNLAPSDIHGGFGVPDSAWSRHLAAGQEAELTKVDMMARADRGEIVLEGMAPNAYETMAYARHPENANRIRTLQIEKGLIHSGKLREYGPNIVLCDDKAYEAGDIHYDDVTESLTGVPEEVNARLSKIRQCYDGSQQGLKSLSEMRQPVGRFCPIETLRREQLANYTEQVTPGTEKSMNKKALKNRFRNIQTAPEAGVGVENQNDYSAPDF